MKLTVKSVLLALLLAVSALVLPSSAQAQHSADARDYAWGYWSDPALQVKARADGYAEPGTKSAWQFKRGHRQTGKRQVRVIYRTWYFDPDTFGAWVTGHWKGIAPGQKMIVKGPLVFGCYYRDGHIGAQMVAQVRKKVHGHWSAPRELQTQTGTFIFNC
jgi:hypothetical protein